MCTRVHQVTAQEAALAQRNRELWVLNEVLAAVNSSCGLEELLVQVTERLCRSLEADGCSLYLAYEGDTPLVVVCSGPGHVSTLLRPREVIKGGPLWRQFEEETSLSCLSLDQLAEEDRPGLVGGVEEGLVCALRAKGGLLGLAVLRGPEGWECILESGFWNALGEQIGLAVQNARLIEAAQERAAAAQARVKELDAFIYAISHDLKSPLSKVHGFSEVLGEDYAELLGEPGRMCLERIGANVRIMAQMIDEILVLARLSQDEQPPEPVDLNRVVNAVLLERYPEMKARGVAVRINPDKLPTVVGQEIWLEQVFANLVSNAIKFIGDDHPDPKIEIGWEAQEREMVFWVSDNGVGIAREDQERIFEPFTRLHTVRRDGTGLGLAIVRRVVEGANGRVWVESEPGAGSRFCFSWPKSI